MKSKFVLHITLCASLVLAACSTTKTKVAVVVDPVTYEEIKESVDNYVFSISTPDRDGVLIVDLWNHPDSIKSRLYDLYISDNLEGAVFIGDIPVPMIRDAQHLTTAFKMNQERYDWIDSSVPSDRFYDDFDLRFEYLGADTTNTLAHYYSLRADSPQNISCDIYSARIKAPDDSCKYEAVEAFLNKAAAYHKNPGKMQKILHFGGHGYNSESMNARIDEAVVLNEQFPFLKGEHGRLEYIDHTFDNYVKYRLMSAVGDSTLDLAILHHHGSEDTQYLSGSPVVSDANSWIGLTRNYLRSLMRRSKNPAKTAQDLAKRFEVPQNWMNDAFTKKRIEEDSLHDARMNIVIDDMKGYKSGARVVILDACYNGAFINKDYIAAHYLFNPGNTIVVKGNTVNTLQDTWTTELMGLMNLGVCLGNWAKGELTLESHLFGDPTFAFIPQKELYEGVAGNLPVRIVTDKNNEKYWRRLLESNDDSMVPEVKALAIKMLHNLNAVTSGELLELAEQSESAVVRLEAFMTNKQIADENLSKAISVALDDSYELTRRLALITAGKNGDVSLLPQIADMIYNPATTARENFQAYTAMDVFDFNAAEKELLSARERYIDWRGKVVDDNIIERVRRSFESDTASFNALMRQDTPARDMRLTISSQRNGCNPFAIEGLFYVAENSSDKSLQLSAVEALGWYRYSYRKGYIVEKCEELFERSEDARLKQELEKTINRLKN